MADKPLYECCGTGWKMIRGDCLAVLPQLAIQVDAIVTDPPHQVFYDHNFRSGFAALRREWFRAALARLRPGGFVVCLAGPDNLRDVLATFEALDLGPAGIRWRTSLRGPGRLLHQPAVVGRKAHYDTAVVQAEPGDDAPPIGWSQTIETDPPQPRVRRGPDAQPEDRLVVSSLPFIRWLVEAFAPKDGLVLDPLAGAGTTLLAALETGRRGIGIELDAGRFADACGRLETACVARERKGDS